MSPTTAAQQLQIISEHQNALTISSRSQQQQQQYNSQQQSSVSGQQPIHFDQALGYLNKIKVIFYSK